MLDNSNEANYSQALRKNLQTKKKEDITKQQETK
jgi:hypothetical protein